MRIAVKVVAIGTFALLAGCSSLNPFASKPKPRNVPAPLQDFRQTMAVRTAWTASVGKAGAYTFTPALARGSVFTAAADGTISRISAVTGTTEWQVKAEMPLTAGVGTDGGVVAVAGEKGALLAYDGDGKFLWKAQASSEILSAPAVGQGFVVVRSLDNRIAGYDVATGKRKWVVQRSTPALAMRSAPGLVIIGPTVVVALPGGRMLSLMLSNGGVRWEVAVGDPRGATELERIADVSGFPALHGREACATAHRGRIGCLDVVTGEVHWAKKLSSSVGPAMDERFVFAADENGAVVAFTRDGGQNVWRNDKLAHRDLSAPAAFGRAVAVADGQGYVHFLSREDGSLVGRVAIDGSPVLATPFSDGNRLIVQTKAGTLAAITAD
ncbi:MAG: outer membrane protein assembly factor BamB [Burkholderiaceae bacterium]|nr:outer membrane protein assembly factor BamB [Burkholderiaceae bacterium]